ncbi:MAG TPA: alpha,alpha-trehalase TreF [Chitinophagaceae bacterium]|nr:alpha,alpha-trehalase TreF [Chitinophagaceae bacterium]
MQTQDIYEVSELFKDVQMQQVFPDGKTFPDCLPKFPQDEINRHYMLEKQSPSFSLQAFISRNFLLPAVYSSNYKADTSEPVQKHIEALWSVLTRTPGNEKSSLIPLPKPYIVPGGRFGEIYYWDSYFTMLGLQVSRRVEMIQNMVDNFSYLIDTIGYIPNGNRTYFKGRSQPPFYSLMIQLLREEKGDDVLVKYLPFLAKEYAFWMAGRDKLDDDYAADAHVACLPGGAILNRYWDEYNTARPESYKEDIELQHSAGNNDGELFRHIRAAAESGWDFSSRWFKDNHSFSTIHTTDIIPVDLNCLLFYLEHTLAEASLIAGKKQDAFSYSMLAAKRKTAIQQYCWNKHRQFFTDYDCKAGSLNDNITMAGMFPLFFGIATADQAEKASVMLHTHLVKTGGCVTTTEKTGQQWDSPNGWAPLQYIAIKGLERYGMHNLAAEIARRWIALNIKVYKSTGKLMEKYNVVDTHLLAGGGEYPSQDGFGWTNGVLLKLMQVYK